MFRILEKYKEKGQFDFKETDRLSFKCNAPRGNNSGIYIIYAEEIDIENLIYIGISGREGKSGEIIHRRDGLGGRIVNGKQFGNGRRRSWPRKMYEDNINALKIKWFVTYGAHDHDFPRPLERSFLDILESKNGNLPLWNRKF